MTPRSASTTMAGATELRRAYQALAQAHRTSDHLARYASAHVAALRAAAAVLAAGVAVGGSTRGRQQRNAWVLLAQRAPELAEWAALFAAGAAKRSAAEAGLSRSVSVREADDLLRAAEEFCELVESMLGVPRQLGYSETWVRAS